MSVRVGVSTEAMLLKACPFKTAVSPESLLGPQNIRPGSDMLNSNLHFNKVCR